MRRRPQNPENQAFRSTPTSFVENQTNVGLVLSGGGSRAAYQAGALRALVPFLERMPEKLTVIAGSSIGAINGLVIGSTLKNGMSYAVDELHALWLERTFRNTFAGHPSMAFFRAVRMALQQYMSPGPSATDRSIFDPTPLMERIDSVIDSHGGLKPEDRAPHLHAVAVMTTVEAATRKPLVFVSTHKPIAKELMEGAAFEVCYVPTLHAKHGFASAALPSVLPPVELDTEHGKVRLVDGGISQNIPVDPVVRLGAERVIVIDISGRTWWLNRYGEAHDSRPAWEVPAGTDTYCMRPPETFVIRNEQPFGPLLREAVGSSTTKFMQACGATSPLFTLIKQKLGEEVAYEVMSYIALHPDYSQALIERGFNEASSMLKNKNKIDFQVQAEEEEARRKAGT